MQPIKINLETLYTPWTLDTCQTFTMKNETGRIIDDACEYDPKTGLERKTPLELTYDDFDWTYDNKGYLKELSINLIDLLNVNILDDVILKVEADGEPQSPREYNYITDHLFINWTVNIEALHAYIEANQADYSENKIKSCDGFSWGGDDNQTMLAYYLDAVSAKKYTSDDYYMDQIENVDAMEFIDWESIDNTPEIDTDNDLIRLWNEFADVPINNDDNIETSFYQFAKGTPKMDVWQWFDNVRPSMTLAKLMQL